MSLLTRLSSRSAAVAAAVAVAASMALVSPTAAHAADPQVCVTGKAPSAATQPWYDFARSANSMWSAKRDFDTLNAAFVAAVRKLGPSSTQAQVDQVADAFGQRFEGLYFTVQMGAIADAQIAAYELSGSLRLISPAAADAAEIDLSTSFSSTVVPAVTQVTDNAGPVSTYLNTLFDNLTGTFPLTGPVVVPSPAAASAALVTAAKAIDTWFARGESKVVYSGVRRTCTTTASLSVSPTAMKHGRARTVTISSSKAGNAMRGDYAVLLDGKQVAAESQQSKLAVSLPANLSAGSHILTVAFAPVDGSPISTRSVTVKVAKARTVTRLKLSKPAVTAGKPVRATVRVTVPGTRVKASGTVTLKVGSKTVKAKVRRGKATVLLGRPAAGRYTIRAVFSGGQSLAKSTSTKARLTVRG